MNARLHLTVFCTCLSVVICLSVANCSISLAQRGGEAPQRRMITLGWNQPTLEQMVRDASTIDDLPIDGSVVSIRLQKEAAKSISAEPFANAHSRDQWPLAAFQSTIDLASALPRHVTEDSWIGLHANPGDVNFLDDEGWRQIVAHWQLAARLAKAGGFRGLWFDPEAYVDPYSQFQASTFLDEAGGLTFELLAEAARRRGRQVMQAIDSEYPRCEIASCFWMSFLLKDRLMMGPTPIDENANRKKDFAWRLAGHQYGLLPAFMTGMLEAASKQVVFHEGCEYAYWFESNEAFQRHRQDVRRRGRALIDAEVRQKYDAQVRLAFPVFTDLATENLIPHWTLHPDQQDRGNVFRQQLCRAAAASDQMIWLYGERGSWWPEPKETALWKGKDVYPHWKDLIPNCLDSLQQTKQGLFPKHAKPATEAKISTLQTAPAFREPMLAELKWSKLLPDSPLVTAGPQQVTITGPGGGAAVADLEVQAGDRVRLRAMVAQSGRGMPRLMVQFVDAKNAKIESQRQMPGSPPTTLFYAYPEEGNPETIRDIKLTFTAPSGAVKAKIHCLATEMVSKHDQVCFRFAENSPKSGSD